MGIFSFLRKKELNTNIFSFMLGFEPPRMGEKEFLESYKGWVYACVNAIAEELGMMEYKLQQMTKEGWKDIPTHPALDLLSMVNPVMSSYDLFFASQAYLELHGNTFWYLP